MQRSISLLSLLQIKGVYHLQSVLKPYLVHLLSISAPLKENDLQVNSGSSFYLGQTTCQTSLPALSVLTGALS